MPSILRPATALAFTLALASVQVQGQQTAPSASAESAAAAARYSVDGTVIGDLLDDPNACAVLDKHIPGFSTNDQVDLARGMTLRGIQPFAQDTMTDEVLATIDAELAQLSPGTVAHGS